MVWRCVSVHVGLGKLSGRDLPGEENVQLFVCATLALRQAEERPGKYDTSGCGPEEARFSLQIPLSWVPK